jgi:hypothetical protein
LGSRHGRIADDLDPVSEPHTLDQFWQLVMAVDAAPIFLRAFDKLEDRSGPSPTKTTAPLRGAFDALQKTSQSIPTTS